VSGFSVDPAELRALARALSQAAEDVTSLARHPDGRPDPSRGGLFAALARFRDASDHATAELVRDVEGTADRLIDTARHYEQVDVFPA